MQTNKYAHCPNASLAIHWEFGINRLDEMSPEGVKSWIELCHEIDSRKLGPIELMTLLQSSKLF